MARSEALIRAQEKYNKKTTNYHLRLNNETDADIIEQIKKVDMSAQEYIRKLIRADIEGKVNWE